jgi:serine/threonine protein kinase
VVFHTTLSHPNVIKLLGHYIDRERQTTYMVLEYADGGTLFDKIKTEVMPKQQIKSYFRDVCEAISYLH